MVIPAGRALLETDLQHFNWDFSQFVTQGGADALLVQTQTWVMKGKFQAALEKLAAQLKAANVPTDHVSLQVTVEPRRQSNRNGVDADKAFQALLSAREHGFHSMSLWFAYLDLAAPLDYVHRVAELNTRQALTTHP